MNKIRQRCTYLLTDIMTASVAWLLFNVLRYYETAKHGFSTLTDFLSYYQVVKGQILIPIFWLILNFISGYYNKPFGKSRLGELFSTFVTVIVGSVIIFLLSYSMNYPKPFRFIIISFLPWC